MTEQDSESTQPKPDSRFADLVCIAETRTCPEPVAFVCPACRESYCEPHRQQLHGYTHTVRNYWD